MNARTVYLPVLAHGVLIVLPSCQHVVYAADMANLNRRYANGEITKKQYEERKAHFDFERSLAGPLITVGFTGPNQPSRTSRDLQPAIPPLTALPGTYTYTPPPQYVYVQGPAHRPGGGYTPSQPPSYVYHEQPARPQAQFTPSPSPTYVYHERAPIQQTEYRPTPAPEYVYNKQPLQTAMADYKPETPPAYVYHQPNTIKTGQSIPVTTQPDKYLYRKDMTLAQQKAFDASNVQKQYPIVNPHDHLAPNVERERERNVQYIGEGGQKTLEKVQEVVVDEYLDKGIGKLITPKVAPAAVPKGFLGKLHDFFLGTAKDGVEEIIAPKSETSKKKP